MDFCPIELRQWYRDQRVLPFVGAGASISVSWKDAKDQEIRGPSWEELVSQATKLLGFADPDLARARGTDLQILEYFKTKNSQETAKLTNWMTQLMNAPDSAIRDSVIHRELALAVKCPIIYTTNFDNFLERAFVLHNRLPVVVAFESEMARVHDCEIVKFHGDLDHPTEIVLTESDYERRLSLSTPMDYRLRSDLLGRVILFIGYSFRDQNVSYLFRLFADEHKGQRGTLVGQRAYIAVADPSDFEIELFGARHIQVIPVRRQNQASDIAQLSREMRT